jgi:hypothetical protein
MTQTIPLLPQACFGAIVTTRAVAAEVDPITVLSLLRRHFNNDWGDLDPEDAAMNKDAIERAEGDRVMSVYKAMPLISGCSGIQTPSFRTAFPETPHTP